MAPKYILNYFPVTGRGETARLLFHLAGVEFTDNQIPHSEWPQHKSDGKRFPLGQMPTLEVDGQVICQTRALNRFLAEEFNLQGSSSLDRALADQVIETILELNEGFVKIKFDQTKDDETKKAELAAFFGTDRCKLLLGFVNCKLRGKSGNFFLGDKVSFVDLVYFVAHEYISACYPAFAGTYPDLAALYKAISEVEPIKKYLASRKHAPVS